jgi:Flp pilus assembly protein TadD
MFKTHPELPGIIEEWFVTTLIKTPGHAPADTLACATTLNQLRTSAGVDQVTQQLIQARKKDPQAQLFPEITATTLGEDYLRAGDANSAIHVLTLVTLAYPDSADAHENLAEAYLKGGQKDLAREHAQKALSILDDQNIPASSWTNTNEYRGEIRKAAEKVLKQLGSAS